MRLEHFEKSMAKLDRYFNKQLNADQLEIYYDRFKNVKATHFAWAVDRIIDNKKPNHFDFPTPAEIRALLPVEEHRPQALKPEDFEPYFPDKKEFAQFKRLLKRIGAKNK